MDSETTNSFLTKFLADPKNHVLYNRFATKFGPWIKELCLLLKLHQEDADDLAQVVLFRFFKGDVLDRFVFDGKEKFRAWLKLVTRNTVLTFVRDRDRRRDSWSVGNPDAQEAVLEAGVEMAPDLELICTEFRSHLDEAKDSVKSCVGEATWQAFLLVTEDNLSAQEAAERLGKNLNDVYQAVSRVRRKLREQLKDWFEVDSDKA